MDISNNKLLELPFQMWRAPKLKDLNVAFNLLKELPSPSTEVIMKRKTIYFIIRIYIIKQMILIYVIVF